MLRFALAAGLLFFPMSAFSRDYCEGNLCFQKKARVTCLKPEVWGILHKVAAQVGPIEITSGCDGRHARRSHHYTGGAVDFRPLQASARAALGVLRSLPEVGGIGTYGNGLLHADIRAERFAWHSTRGTRARYAKRRVGPGRSAPAATRLAAVR